HIARGGTGEEDRGALDFAEFSPTSNGRGADDEITGFVCVGNGDVHLGKKGSRTNSIHVNIERRQLKTQRPRHLHHRALAGCIRRAVGKAYDAQGAGHIDDAAASVLLHVWRYRTAAKSGAVDIHVHHFVEVVRRHFVYRTADIDSRAVDENINPAKHIKCRLHHRLDIRWYGNIARK